MNKEGLDIEILKKLRSARHKCFNFYCKKMAEIDDLEKELIKGMSFKKGNESLNTKKG